MFYGLSREEYDELIAGGCSVCGSHERLHVDHSHTTGAVRGILCSPCNVALGYLCDDPKRIEALAAYARRHAIMRLDLSAGPNPWETPGRPR